MRAILFVRHKCASMWLSTIAESACALMGLPYIYFFKSSRLGINFADFYRKKTYPVISCADPEYAEVQALEGFRAVHVVRDPRDVLVSAYFSHRNRHWFKPGTEAYVHQQRLRLLPKEEGLLAELEFSEHYLGPMTRWQYHVMPNILELKFEAVTAQPYESVLQIFSFLGLLDEAVWPWWQQLIDTPRFIWNRLTRRWGGFGSLPRKIPAEKLLGIVHRLQFARLAHRPQGAEDPQSHYRKGQPGDWRNHFTPALVEAFKARYPGLISQLGYEPDENWTV
jgi:hypothetical protein